ncbi:MAG: PQQ-dependent sugar dehydrogenase [Bryobacterales bacterium]|nr:PQQ-dependent sugar dehydrogenase [Bryobacterales bacterium]
MFRAVGFALLAAATVAAQTKIEFSEVVTGLHRPTFLTHAGDGSGRLFVTEQTGTVRIIHEGAVLATPFLDISAKVTPLDPICCDERGLLSIAFPPNFAQRQHFYVYYTGEANLIHISRFRVKEGNPNEADPDSEEVLFRFQHEFYNHFGGQLAFHPIDQKLYVSFGDGAGGKNPLGSAQDPVHPFGKVWRWDAEAGAEELELYSLGLRNPWRLSFDRVNGDLFIGDIGEDKWEEIDYQPFGRVGANFGWSVLEGNHCLTDPECSHEGFDAPAIAYDHNTGCSITSGYVYRGQEHAAWQGRYFYADFCYGKVWSAEKSGDEWQTDLMQEEINRNWSAFGEDEAGELYVLDYLPGTVYKISPKTSEPVIE